MEKNVKLKSEILIGNFSGYDEISIDDIDKDFDYSDIDVKGLSEEERKQVEEDILNLVKLGGNKIKSISLPHGITIIPNILKEACTEKISFDNSDEYFQKMKATPADILQEGMMYSKLQALKRDNGKEITEFDLFKGSKILSIVESYTADSIEEYEKILKYMPSSMKISVQVRNHEALKRVIALGHTNTILLINKSDLDNLEEIDDKYNIQVRIDNMSELTTEEIVNLRNKCNVTQINVLSEKTAIGRENAFGDSKSVYDIDTYAKLRRAVDVIIKGIDNNASEIEKFTRVYERLAHKIKYDKEAAKYTDTDGKEGKENPNAHNLIGALLEDLSVCDGISRALEQIMYCVGIQAPKVHGTPVNKEEKTGHAWNRIKLDDIWYNVDLTWDLQDIKDGTNPQYCLQSTREFMHDEYEVPNDEQILDNTYNQEALFDKYFSGRRFTIETGDQFYFSASELFEIVSNLKASTQYRAEEIIINMYNVIGDCSINISNCFDGNEIPASYEGGPIFMSPEQLTTLINVYIETAEYKVSKIGEDGKTRISRHDGLSLVLDEELKQMLVTQGVNVDDIVHPIYEINTEALMKKIEEAREDKLREGFGLCIDAKIDTYEIDIDGDDKHYEITENELIEFLQKYGASMGITDEKTKGRSMIELTSDEGVSITIYKDIKEELLKTGCDFRSVFKEQENKKTEILDDEISKNDELQEQTAMVQYKESYIKKIVNKFKEAFYNIKEKKSKANTAKVKMTKSKKLVEKKLPSWDLDNWTQEEKKEAWIAANSETNKNSRTKNEREEDIEK